jgi:D-serine deaminase-like pyridoxal phosphate-dependent protein
VSQDVASLDTPVATVDLDAVERNIARMQGYCDEHGLAFRPHIKTHKLPAIAHLQVRAGAVGITCQKLGEAEVMEAAGLDDILLTFPLVGAAKAERLAALAGEAKVAVVGDSAAVAQGLSPALADAGAEVGFLVEVDTGFARTGVQTADAAADLAALADSLPGLRFDGLMTYPTLAGTGEKLRAAIEAIRARGLEVRTVSAGGTPSFFTNHDVPEVTEVRAGTYVYCDRSCIANGSVPLEDCALRIRATVVSRPTPDRGILDAGSKTLTNDPAEEAAGGGHGLIVEYPEARIYQLSEEHGHVDFSAGTERPEVGEVVTVIPNHACGCTNLHDEVAVHRGGRIVGFWPVAARGKLR